MPDLVGTVNLQVGLPDAQSRASSLITLGADTTQLPGCADTLHGADNTDGAICKTLQIGSTP
jgi:hypothetical protein